MGIDTPRLTRVERGVTNAARTAEFFAWLLELAPEEISGGFRLALANGELLLHEETRTPIALELSTGELEFHAFDPDGVPVMASRSWHHSATQTATLDHVRLNCANLAETT